MLIFRTGNRTSLNRSGDTIIEVLVVLAVLSLAFAISLATANQGLRQARNSEEHSQASGIVASQLELLKSAVDEDNSAINAQIFRINTPFCMSQSDTVEYSTNCDQPTGSGYSYDLSITYIEPNTANPSQNYFSFQVNWPGEGDLGAQQVGLLYKLYPVQ